MRIIACIFYAALGIGSAAGIFGHAALATPLFSTKATVSGQNISDLSQYSDSSLDRRALIHSVPDRLHFDAPCFGYNGQCTTDISSNYTVYSDASYGVLRARADTFANENTNDTVLPIFGAASAAYASFSDVIYLASARLPDGTYLPKGSLVDTAFTFVLNATATGCDGQFNQTDVSLSGSIGGQFGQKVYSSFTGCDNRRPLFETVMYPAYVGYSIQLEEALNVYSLIEVNPAHLGEVGLADAANTAALLVNFQGVTAIYTTASGSIYPTTYPFDAEVPEPAAVMLLGFGLAVLVGVAQPKGLKPVFR